MPTDSIRAEDFASQSGSIFRYLIETSTAVLPKINGLYFLFDEGRVVYIGLSTDCHARIAHHRATGRTQLLE